MNDALRNLLALLTIIVWPVVPLFWIPVHGFPRLFRKMGILTYVVPFVLWLPAGYFIFHSRAFLLHYRAGFPQWLNVAGFIVLAVGCALQLWTGKLLGLWGLMGLPEISKRVKSRLVAEGAFAVVRHPTYLSHTLIFSGVFMVTGVLAVGAITLADFIVINAVIVPLEEKELTSRFDGEYDEYKKKVPRFFPRLRRKR
ncbi:MAG: isoprenylcysteine carboxylmethyltransferase family protein [Candidatus Sulfobium sp.]|jgi:protein-S-isoprenylcysteine O-methyltransferase Ste14